MIRFLKFTFFLVFFITASCTTDKLEPEPTNCTEDYTYTSHTRDIIVKSCAYAGCHVVGFIKGNHTTYQGLLPQLNNGEFKKNVITSRSMPPNYVDEDKKLTEAEIEILSCWISAGFPE